MINSPLDLQLWLTKITTEKSVTAQRNTIKKLLKYPKTDYDDIVIPIAAAHFSILTKVNLSYDVRREVRHSSKLAAVILLATELFTPNKSLELLSKIEPVPIALTIENFIKFATRFKDYPKADLPIVTCYGSLPSEIRIPSGLPKVEYISALTLAYNNHGEPLPIVDDYIAKTFTEIVTGFNYESVLENTSNLITTVRTTLTALEKVHENIKPNNL